MNKEEKEAVSPTCNKVGASLRDEMETFFHNKERLFEFSIVDWVTLLRYTESLVQGE